jgi:hypothetical protein
VAARDAYMAAHAIPTLQAGAFSGALNTAILNWSLATMQAAPPPTPASGNAVVSYSYGTPPVPYAYPVAWTTNPQNWVANQGVTVRVANVN